MGFEQASHIASNSLLALLAMRCYIHPIEHQSTGASSVTPAEQSDFLQGILKAMLQIKDSPPSSLPRNFGACSRDGETAQQQCAAIRRQERSAWVEKSLTDDQRMERARQEIAMRNDQLRGAPTCFGDSL